MWKEFKPAIRFVLAFVGIYFLGNLIYGLYIHSKGNAADEATIFVARQAAVLLNLFGAKVQAVLNVQRPTVFLRSDGITILNVFEGCNGINVFIVFAAFIFAFSGNIKSKIIFIVAGIVILHLANLVRLVLLYWTAINYHRYFYYVHKYIFTAVIYLVVFVLWLVWVNLLNDKKKQAAA